MKHILDFEYEASRGWKIAHFSMVGDVYRWTADKVGHWQLESDSADYEQAAYDLHGLIQKEETRANVEVLEGVLGGGDE